MKKIRKKLSLSLGREQMLDEIRNNDHSRLTSIREYPTYIDHQVCAESLLEDFSESLDISLIDEWESESEPDFDLHYAFLRRSPPPSPEKPRPPPPPVKKAPPPPIPQSRTPIPPHLRGLKFPPPPLPSNRHPVVPPATKKYNANRQGVIQKVSDISMTNSTFQADIIKAPHVKVETFVCCSIHIGDTECDCEKSLKKKSKMRNLVKIVRGTSFVLGTYILYHLHHLFDYD